MEPPIPDVDSRNKEFQAAVARLASAGIVIAPPNSAVPVYSGVLISMTNDALRMRHMEEKLRVKFKADAVVFSKDSLSCKMMAMAFGSDVEFLQVARGYVAATGSPTLNLLRPLLLEQAAPRKSLAEPHLQEDGLSIPLANANIKSEAGQGGLSNLPPTAGDLVLLDLLLHWASRPAEGYAWYILVPVFGEEDLHGVAPIAFATRRSRA